MNDLREQKAVDRTAAETLIRTSVMALANGAPIRDLDQLVARNASRISHADIMAGRLGSDVLGDIIGTVEQAKGNTAFNWNAATPEQIKAYLAANGLGFADQGRQGVGFTRESRDGAGAGRESGSAEIRFSEITSHNFASSVFAASGISYENFSALRAKGFNETNILHAAQDTRTNGFDVNNKKMNEAFAVLDKEDGKRRDERNDVLKDYRHRLSEDEKFQQLKIEYAKAQTDQDRARIAAQMDARGHEIGKGAPLQDHIKKAPTANARKALESIQTETIRTEGGIKELTNGNKAEAEADTETVRLARLRPEDVKARQNYDALKRKVSHDPRKEAALKKIEASVAKMADEKKANVADNKAKEEERKTKVVASSALDDEMAALVAKPKAAEAPQRPDKKAETDTSKPSGHSKVADSSVKPAAKSAAPAPA